MTHDDVFGLEMWTSEDPAPELGHSFCILTFRKHARNVTLGNVQWAGYRNELPTDGINADFQHQNVKMMMTLLHVPSWIIIFISK